MKFKDTIPLIGLVVPTLVIGCGFVIPNSAIAGVNELSASKRPSSGRAWRMAPASTWS